MENVEKHTIKPELIDDLQNRILSFKADDFFSTDGTFELGFDLKFYQFCQTVQKYNDEGNWIAISSKFENTSEELDKA